MAPKRSSDNAGETGPFKSISAGREISHYRIIKPIGSGGMGDVYLAEDIRLQRKVALKFLPPELTRNPEAKERFINEARAASSLEHTNICTIHEIDEIDDGRMFIAMAYCEGETLKEKIAGGALDIKQATNITIQIARGLSAAHKQGIIHRDIKPANIIINDEGHVKLVDFGLAKLIGNGQLTRDGRRQGTISYMSPEQARGERIDHRTDIWSLGVILYEMLTGHAPFRGEYDEAIIYSIVNTDPEPLTDYRKDIPDGFQKIVERILDKDQQTRYQSMSDLLEALGERPPDERPWRVFALKNRKRKYALALLASAAILISAWAMTSYLSTRGIQEELKWRLGVLPFRNTALEASVSEWPAIIQTLFASDLTGVTDIGIVDPLSLNSIINNKFGGSDPPREEKFYRTIKDAEISHIIDGTIASAEDGYVIHSGLIDPRSAELVFSTESKVVDENDLPLVIRDQAQNILNYFQTKILELGYEEDLKPWLSNRTRNLEAVKAFMQASQFLFKGIPGSKKYLQRAIEIDSSFIAPRIWLISGLVQDGKYQEAKDQFETLLEFESGANPFEQAMIGWLGAFLDGDEKQQISALQLALAYSPGNNILLYVMAGSLYKIGDFKGVVETLSPAIDEGWEYSAAHYLVGLTYSDLGEFSDARKVLERSLTITPVYPYTYGLLSTLSSKAGDYARALEYEALLIRELGKFNMQLDGIYGMLADNYLDYGCLADAERCYRLAISQSPHNPAFHNGLGETLYLMGDHDKAREEYLLVLEIDSTQINSYKMLGQISDAKGERQQASNYYKAYLKRDSTSSDAMLINELLSMLNQRY